MHVSQFGLGGGERVRVPTCPHRQLVSTDRSQELGTRRGRIVPERFDLLDGGG